MKTKVLFGLLVTAVVLIGLSSCKHNDDTMDVISDVAQSTFKATKYRAAIKADETAGSLTTMEYNFVSPDTIKKTFGQWGNGVQYTYTSKYYTYRQGAFGEKNVGIYYTLIPVDGSEEEVIKFENNNFLDKDGYLCNQNFSTIDAIASVDDNFANSDWTIDTIVYWTKDVEKIVGYDTIKHIEKDPQTGKKHWVIDTIMPHKGVVKDTLGLKYVAKGTLSFYRDIASVNTGEADYGWWSYPKGDTVPSDSIILSGNMTWSLASMTSAKKFTLVADFEKDGKKNIVFSDFSVTRDKETGEITDKTITLNEFPLKWVKN